MKLGLCGNIPLGPLAEAIDTILPECDIIVGKQDYYTDELTDAPGEFASLDTCVLALDWRSVSPKIYDFGYGDDAASAIAEFEKACNTVCNALSNFRKTTTSRVLVLSPVADCLHPLGFVNRSQKDSPFELFLKCQATFDTMCKSVPDVYILDADEISRFIGFSKTYDARQFALTGMPFSSHMISNIALRIIDTQTQFDKAPLKCLVLDCDNTLWGGIVGETGMDKIVLGDSGEGRSYKDFQREIVKLYKQGVILAINSKNNTCDALEVFEQHPHMLIRTNMISCFRINWDDKPSNMLQIAEELNIGLDSILFFDDNPSEQAMMRSSLPQVTVPAIPQEPHLYATMLKTCSRFWPIQLTMEDSLKTQAYAAQRVRLSAQNLAKNVEAFLHSSQIRVSIHKADDAAFPRIVQLFNKTNQFNLTTKRYSESQLRDIAKKPNNELLYMSMQDKYGDYGIIACACIIEDCIDSFILSCRAFGKHAETALLAHIISAMNKTKRRSVYGLYIPTLKNSMAKDFYKNNGFILQQTIDTVQTWRLDDLLNLPKPPGWVTGA